VYYRVQENPSGQLFLKNSVTVLSSLAFIVWIGNTRLSLTHFSHIARNGEIKHASDINNIWATIRSIETDTQMTDTLETIEEKLQKILPAIEEKKAQKLSFIIEQLRLLTKKPKGRQFSPSLTACALSWLTTSAALYKQLLEEDILTISSVRYLRHISQAFSVVNSLQ